MFSLSADHSASSRAFIIFSSHERREHIGRPASSPTTQVMPSELSRIGPFVTGGHAQQLSSPEKTAHSSDDHLQFIAPRYVITDHGAADLRLTRLTTPSLLCCTPMCFIRLSRYMELSFQLYRVRSRPFYNHLFLIFQKFVNVVQNAIFLFA